MINPELGNPGRRTWADPSGRTDKLAGEKSSAMPEGAAAVSSVQTAAHAAPSFWASSAPAGGGRASSSRATQNIQAFLGTGLPRPSPGRSISRLVPNRRSAPSGTRPAFASTASASRSPNSLSPNRTSTVAVWPVVLTCSPRPAPDWMRRLNQPGAEGSGSLPSGGFAVGIDRREALDDAARVFRPGGCVLGHQISDQVAHGWRRLGGQGIQSRAAARDDRGTPPHSSR